jgi:hypothetical protein
MYGLKYLRENYQERNHNCRTLVSAVAEPSSFFYRVQVRRVRRQIGQLRAAASIRSRIPATLRADKLSSTCQRPCGAASQIRSPLGARPHCRGMVVVTPLSSSKISFSGGIAATAARNSWRRLRLASVSRSSA